MSTNPMGGRDSKKPASASLPTPVSAMRFRYKSSLPSWSNGWPNKLACFVNKVDIELLQGPGTTCMEYILYHIKCPTSRLYSASWPQWGITLIKQHHIHKYTHTQICRVHEVSEFLKINWWAPGALAAASCSVPPSPIWFSPQLPSHVKIMIIKMWAYKINQHQSIQS